MKQTNLEWLLTQTVAEAEDAYANRWIDTRNRKGTHYAQDRYDMLAWLASPRIEPITLTAEERKAAELAVAIGLPWIKYTGYITGVYSNDFESIREVIAAVNIPGLRALAHCDGHARSTWITAEPLDLRELLKEGTR